MTRALHIHIGLHKTGTSFLQQSVFPRWPGIEYLGRPYDPGLVLERIVHADPGQKFLLSNEKFLLPALSPKFLDPETRPRTVSEMREHCLVRLKQLFPEASIVIGLREPARWVESVYNNYVIWGGTKPPEAFALPAAGDGVVSEEDLDFARCLQRVAELWPRTFPFDHRQMNEDPAQLLRDLAGFLGTPVPDAPASVRLNPSLSNDALERVRALNLTNPASEARRALVEELRREAQAGGGNGRLRFPEEVSRRVGERTARSWREALELIDVLRRR